MYLKLIFYLFFILFVFIHYGTGENEFQRFDKHEKGKKNIESNETITILSTQINGVSVIALKQKNLSLDMKSKLIEKHPY